MCFSRFFFVVFVCFFFNCKVERLKCGVRLWESRSFHVGFVIGWSFVPSVLAHLRNSFALVGSRSEWRPVARGILI